MKKILFFVNGFAPSGEDMKAMSNVDGQVLFRNVQLFDENEPLEKCDGVMGLVPEPYAEKYKVKQAKFEKKESE